MKPPAAAPSPPLAPCFRKTWGPMLLSSGSRDVIGVSAATGVGQVGILWIESEQEESEVWFTRIAGSKKEGPGKITRGASAYPPTAIAWTGKEFALAWGDDRHRRIEIFVARVSAWGRVTLSPRQFTRTRSPTEDVHAAADSSQEPAMAYYNGNLLIVWGGPGDRGRQQVYHTTISKAGKPIYSPYEITQGPFDHTGLNLASLEEGAGLHFCVKGGDGGKLMRVVLDGTPPRAASQPEGIASTLYSPCWSTEVSVGRASIVLWATRSEKRGIVECNLFMTDVSIGEGYGKSFRVESVEITKFPGRFRHAFDAASAGGRAAVAWVHSPPGEEQSLRTGLFTAEGKAECGPVEMETGLVPTDPRILYSGYGLQYVVLWVEREVGGNVQSLVAEGIEAFPP